MTVSDHGHALIDQFRSLPLHERKAVIGALSHIGVPEDYSGFFVDQTKPEDERRSEVLYELDALINAQSIGFMVEIIPLMYPFFKKLCGRGRHIEALDVGSRTAAGTALLSDIFISHHSRVPTWFDSIEIDSTFDEYRQSRWPHLRASIIGDIFELPKNSYDYVICSHTIEHLDNPTEFCHKMQDIARDYVFITCPFEEQHPIYGHRKITSSFIDSLSPIGKHVFDSWWWKAQDGSREVAFFVLPGGNMSSCKSEFDAT